MQSGNPGGGEGSRVPSERGTPPGGHQCVMCLTPIEGRANRRYCSDYCRNRAAKLKSRYGLSAEQYRRLVAAQNGKCPICLARVKKWQVDHNHKTGEITSVVCLRCNTGPLAYTNHDPEIAQRLADFLRDPPARRILGGVFVPPNARRESNLHTVWRSRKPKRRPRPRKTRK